MFTKVPIIIGGCARSGTTLLLAILGAHPSIFAIPEETGVFAGQEGKLILDFLPQSSWDRVRWCEKTPNNVLCFLTTHSRFQGLVKLIHIVRDGRDVVTSRHPQDPDKFWVSPKRWVTDANAGKDAKHISHLVRYEDLVSNFLPTMEHILAFINEAWCSEISEYPFFTNIKTDPAWKSEVSSLSYKSIGRWRDPKYADRIAEFYAEPGAKELLEIYGYAL